MIPVSGMKIRRLPIGLLKRSALTASNVALYASTTPQKKSSSMGFRALPYIEEVALPYVLGKLELEYTNQRSSVPCTGEAREVNDVQNSFGGRNSPAVARFSHSGNPSNSRRQTESLGTSASRGRWQTGSVRHLDGDKAAIQRRAESQRWRFRSFPAVGQGSIRRTSGQQLER